MRTDIDDTTRETLETVERFNDATNRHDVDTMMSLMTDDVVFESTAPPPDGGRFEGAAAVRECWEALFLGSPRARFETEELFASGDRCTARWRYLFDADDREAGHIRGVDVFRVRDGRLSEKLSYVKG